MPETNQIFWKHRELLEILIKEAGVHEGKWMIAAGIGFGPGNFGPSPEQTGPGAVVIVQQIGISRAGSDTPEAMTLDAAKVNPLSKTVSD